MAVSANPNSPATAPIRSRARAALAFVDPDCMASSVGGCNSFRIPRTWSLPLGELLLHLLVLGAVTAQRGQLVSPEPGVAITACHRTTGLCDEGGIAAVGPIRRSACEKPAAIPFC